MFAISGRSLSTWSKIISRMNFKSCPNKRPGHLIGTDAYIGALKIMGNGHLHPLNLCIGEARAAVQQGATIYEQSPVRHISKKAGTPRVITENGSVSADFVVLAGNAYQFLEPGDYVARLFPVNSFIIATEPLSEDLVAADQSRGPGGLRSQFRARVLSPQCRQALAIRWPNQLLRRRPRVIKLNLQPRMCRIYPQLINTRIDYAWGGTIGVTLSRVPQMGRTAPNIIYSQGYSGHGVNVTHLAGQILADTIAGSLERFDVFAKIKPIVVPGSGIFSKQMVALGMVYYRLRDLL